MSLSSIPVQISRLGTWTVLCLIPLLDVLLILRLFYILFVVFTTYLANFSYVLHSIDLFF